MLTAMAVGCLLGCTKMKQIKDFENYFVEEDGTIWSTNQKGRKTSKPSPVLKRLKARIHSRGYLFVDLKRGMNSYQKLVHRLVAETFIPNPENKPYVCHKDNNKKNPHKDNLCWGTQKENMLHHFKSKEFW